MIFTWLSQCSDPAWEHIPPTHSLPGLSGFSRAGSTSAFPSSPSKGQGAAALLPCPAVWVGFDAPAAIPPPLPEGEGAEPNLFAKVIQERGESHSSLRREGEEGGSRTRNQWRLGKTLSDRPQGFELYQFPWNLDAAKNT